MTQRSEQQTSHRRTEILQQFTAADFFGFRTPLLPFDEYIQWTGVLHASDPSVESGNLEQALHQDRQRLSKQLLQIASRAEIREALFIASPDLSNSLDHWSENPTSIRSRKIESAFLRYFLRMTTRPTPFGLFAGYSIGIPGETTRLEISDRSEYTRHTRPDMDFLFAFAEAMNSNPDTRKTLLYRTNTTLHIAAGLVRYVESRLRDKARTYHLVTVEETEEIHATIIRAQVPETIDSLAAPFISAEISKDEAINFIHDLIDAQVLVPEIALPVHGPEPLLSLIAHLNANSVTSHFSGAFKKAHDQLTLMDRKLQAAHPEDYFGVAHLLEELPVRVDMKHLFQVDMMKPAPSAILGKTVIAELLRGVGILHSMSDARNQKGLRSFRDTFVKRYEQREIPLLEALDEEMGIGFGDADENSPLLDGIPFHEPDPADADWSDQQAVLLRKVHHAVSRKEQTIELSETDLKSLQSPDTLPIPDSFAVMGILAGESEEAVAGGNFQVLIENAHSGGARLLGRFCHTDPQLRSYVQHYLKQEEIHHPDAIFAEIVHLPEGRLGNILARPQMARYEIPYLGYSAAKEEHKIHARDLRISVRNGKIILRSACLGKRVIPRLTNAHNYDRNSLGVYRFLCNFQFQESVTWLGWNWGALKAAPFLPRVTNGRLILSVARWRLDQEEIERLKKKSGTALFQTIREMRTELTLPRFVVVRDYDHALLIDFDNILSIEMFVHSIQSRNEAILTEVFPDPDRLCVSGPEGTFFHELVVPFVRKTVPAATTPAEALAHKPSHQDHRSFIPGSEWVYIKLYAGTVSIDHLLREFLPSFIESLKNSGEIDSWFFLRYGDPDWHMRVRLRRAKTLSDSEIPGVLTESFSTLQKAGKIHRAQLDTYDREIERYGGFPGIILAEEFFHIDSEAVLEILQTFESGDKALEERWKLTLCGMNLLLNGFGFDVAKKLSVITEARNAFGKEFHVSKVVTQSLSRKFRNVRSDLESLLDPDYVAENDSSSLRILKERTCRLIPVFERMQEYARDGKITAPLEDLAMSYIHMHANRMLRSAHRKQELVLYDFLKTLYQSQLARRCKTE